MQLKLPSPEEIYDLSTDQLAKLKSQLAFDINKKQKSLSTNKNGSNDEIQTLKQLLENIQLQIQQRKTIEFFTQLCINDGTANKYVKEITDFNNEFTKLANQMLNNKSGVQSLEQRESHQLKNEENYLKGNNEKFQHLSESRHEKQQFQRRQSQTTINSQDLSTDHHSNATQTSHFTKSTTSDLTKTMSKQMGLGQPNMKKNKKSMQDFIKATLAKSKAVDYVSTKGGIIKNTPDKVQKNGSHVSSNNNEASRTPFSTSKSIKPPSQGSELGSHRSENKRPSQSSSKNVPIQSNKSISEKNDRSSLMKKRNQVIEKVKNMKKPQSNTGSQSHPPQPPKKKTTKGLDPKSLVQMVKLQQDSKKKRQQQQLQALQKPRQEKIQKKEQQKQGKKQQMISMTSISGQKQEDSNLALIKVEMKSKEVINASTQKFQPQFPIKQQINPILSSSDTQSDTDSVKLITRQKQKKNSYKQGLAKNEKCCPIPQEEIQESIAALKQIKPQQEKGKLNEFEVTINQNVTKQQERKVDNVLKNSIQARKQTINHQVLKKTEKQSSKNQVFGKITEEQYNSYGNDYRYDDQLKPQNHQRIIQNNDEIKENQNDQNELEKHSNKQVEIDQKNTTKIIKSSNSDTKKSQKTLNDGQKKEQKRKNSKEYSVTPSLEEFQSTKMYNEQYWLHIKQQAESKIQRFKQQKELQRKERQYKAKLIEQESKRLKAQLQGKKNHKQKKQHVDSSFNEDEKLKSEQKDKQVLSKQDDNDKFIQQQKDNLKKIYAENNINGSSKKASKKPMMAAIVKQLKPSFPKPQFNYLEIYPTFNHIFNVFYTKSQGQAILDIPLIMKEIIEMFQTHIDFQKSRKNSFRPAIFLPFDSRNSKINQFTDARLLLQHAQTTYVNLKTLIQRVQIFNSNIQGEFENCTDEQREKTQFYRVVKTRQEVYDIISTSFLRRKGWKQLPHGQNLKANWNLFWSWAKPEIDMNKLLIFQRINHFPFNKNLSRKDLLYKNIESFRKTHKVPFPYLPITYNLPKQFTQFSKKFHEQEMVNRDKNYWIMKPIGKSRGRGIKLINSLGDLNYLDNIVVQKYISNPLLIDGYKFDMRIYVLVTSFHPLQAFVYREGFARFSTEKYSLQPMDMKNNFVHLTNFAVNKDNKQADDQFSQGSKISLKSLKQRVTKMGYSFASVWSQVHEIIIKSLLACSVSVPPFPAAFELFGYDVMLDDKGQCYLIQINSSPSLERSYMIDEVIKQSLIDDIIEIVNPPAFSKEEAINVMNERLSPDFRNNKKSTQKGANVDQQDLIHMARILKYQKLRKYGQMPDKIGLFEMVAPSPMSKDLQKLIKSKSGINAPHNID